MDKNKSELNRYLSTDVLDIIFLNRNKSYGAYELRKNYHRRVKKTLGIVLTGALLVSSIPLLASLNEDDVHPIPITHHGPDIIQVIPVDVNPVEIPIEKPIVKEIIDVASLKSTIPEIVPDEDAKEDLMHTQEELKTANTGAEDKEGKVGEDLTTVITKDPIENGGGGMVVETKPEDNTIFNETDIEFFPEFPGGEEELMKYLSSAIKYPERAVRENVEGRVVVGFVVNKNGEIEDLKVKRSLGFGCDDEALRVIKSMPKWKPGKFNGKSVNVYYDLPIQFALEGN